MKHLFFIFSSLLAVNAMASIQVDNDNKVVNWSPTYNLEINLTPAAVNDNQYGILSYNWYMNSATASSEYQSLKNSYPGYAIKRIDLEAVSGLALTIPAAGFQLPLTALPNQSGFYAENNEVLNKQQYLAITAAQNANPTSFARLLGTVTTHVDVYQVVESKTLTPDICKSLIGNGTLGDMLRNVFSYGAQSVRDQSIRNQPMERLFSSAIGSSCFTINSASSVNSMQDLMALGLKLALTQNVVVNYESPTSTRVDSPVPYQLAPWSNGN